MAEKQSAIQETLSKVEDQLTCPVCLEPFTNPRLLACFHVYCERCLDRLVVYDLQGQFSVTCPKCRRITTLPRSGVSGLQAAFHVHHLFDIQRTLEKVNEPQKLACEKCLATTARVATSFCRDCQKFICEFCNTVHKEWEDFKSHNVLSMETVKGDLIRLVSPKKASPRCLKHNKSLKVYCEPCGELICKDCIVHLHRDHDYCLIADTFESHKREILDSLGPVEKELLAAKEVMVDLDSRHKNITQQRENVEAEIRKTFEDMRKEINTREAKVVAQLEGHTQEQLKVISARQKKMETLQTQCSSCLHFVRESIRTGSPGDVVKMKQGVVKQVRELVHTFDPCTLEPCKQDSICFIPSSQLTLLVSVIPAKRLEKSGPRQLIAAVRTLTRSPILNLGAKIVSTLTDRVMKCVVKQSDRGVYEISCRPKQSGAHKLYVTVGGEEARGGPFPVTMKIAVNELGTNVKTLKDVRGPCGVAVNKSGEVLVGERDAGVVSIFSPRGERLRTLNKKGSAVGELKGIQALRVDSDDNILLIDSERHQVLKISPDGDLIACTGGNGNGPGQFMDPHGLCVNCINGKVYVVDRADAHCIQIFNSDLTFCSKFGRKGKGKSNFDYPDDIASDPSGSLYVSDCSNFRVKVFTPDGAYLRQFEEFPFGMRGYGPGSICVDNDYLVYVAVRMHMYTFTQNRQYESILVFTSEGICLKAFESGDRSPRHGIAVDPNGVLHVCYYDNTVKSF